MGIKNSFLSFFNNISIGRLSLDDVLVPMFKRLREGIVLDVGSENSPYKKFILHKKYLRLDINPKNKPDICSDIHKIKWKSNYFDTVIATEVLEHLYDPRKAVKEIKRILKPGGVCILSTRFCYRYHANPKDYYRFSVDSLEDLFSGFKKKEIVPHGNRIQLIWHIINRNYFVLNVFSPLIAKIKFKDNLFPLGYVVYAVK
jgi:SAM-dependent methyltransferase